MRLKARISEGWRGGLVGALLCAVLGFLLWFFPGLGEGLAFLSYDYGFLVRPPVGQFADVEIVYITEETLKQYQQPSLDNWDRGVHAQLLDYLRADGARLVVFDIYFSDRPSSGNAAFARAMREHGNVVLAAVEEKNPAPGLQMKATILPAGFHAAARDCGIAVVMGDSQTIVRQYHQGNVQGASLPMAAARAVGRGPTHATPADLEQHWLNYYGRFGTVIPSKSYQAVTNQAPGFFRGKFVFIGGRKGPDSLKESGSRSDTPGNKFRPDEYPTPFSRWGAEPMPGVEITATAFLNLIGYEWLTRLSSAKECLLVLASGALFGFLLALVRPLPAVGLAVLGFVVVSITSLFLLWETRVWWPWLWVAGAQIPLAVGWSVLTQTKRLSRQKEVLEKVIESSLTAQAVRQAASRSEASALSIGSNSPEAASLVSVPDHVLLRRVGRGAYGEVWLARNAVGLYRAVKIVRKNEFSREGPYEREFNGIRKFMPVTLQHPRLLHLLHVGRNDLAGYFYTIMEAADDEATGTQIDPDRYVPRTLAAVLKKHGPLSPAECIPLVLALTDALGFLHERRLIHRDIKPSNIIFAEGVAKLADIGLVTDAAHTGQAVTLIGTAGYMAPEGPGSAVSDLYSLGKVMYEALLGREPDLFPELPTGLDRRADAAFVLELNRIIGKICQTDPRRRYQTAAEIRTEMEQLQQRMQAPGRLPEPK